LALAIIDEQHRFGTKQRKALVTKNLDEKLPGEKTFAPHLLSMTATPIPRTLALTIYGDLDLTVLDELPAGRKPVITKLVEPDGRNQIYEEIRKELQAGRQAYVICPRIDEPDKEKEQALITKSVKEEAKRLKKEIFGEFEIGVMHSKMSAEEKEKVMTEFKHGKINILCSTSVVEVGVNVPNATVIVIEGADRFGLSQLHQLRGRVLRSSHQSFCYLFSESTGLKTRERMNAILKAKNGFELAELDLEARGAGELSGVKQWGISDIAMEALRNLKMVEYARMEALEIVKQDKGLENYPTLKEIIEKAEKTQHFE
jgi:ATP-dependent DNA helicase RecG